MQNDQVNKTVQSIQSLQAISNRILALEQSEYELVRNASLCLR